jgi:hypothetical protein
VGVLKGRCGCHTVDYEVSDEFIRAFMRHCSNCRATTGSAFLPWGEIEREKFEVTQGYARLLVDALDLNQVPRPLDQALAHVWP